MKGAALAFTLNTLLLSMTAFAQLPDQTPNLLGQRNNTPGSPLMSNITGVVVGSDGGPVANVRVEIRDGQTGRTLASGYTNDSGGFQFENLPMATYDIVATQGLVQTQQRLDAGDPGASVKIRLNTTDASARQADGSATVSVAEYKVPQKARDAFHKAETAIAKNHADEAKKELAKALEAYSDYAPALTLRGVLSLDAGKAQAAAEDFDHAIHSDPSYALAYTAMAAAWNQLNKFDDAVRSAERAITLSPRSWQSYFEIAKAHVGKADYPHALQDLAKAQQLAPKDYAPMHLVRAHVMLALQDYNSAINELQAFITMAPQDPNAPAARTALEKVKAFIASAAHPPVVAPR